MRRCLFCDDAADSLEHLWPQWVLETVKARGPLRHSIRNSPIRLLAKPELKMRCVCTACNGGWMSKREQENIPVLGALMNDIAMPLDAQQQKTIALWATKTAMVAEAVKNDLDRHFNQAERSKLRVESDIPLRTQIWLGRYSGSSIGAFGTDLRINLPESSGSATGSATTIVVGHVALQVLALRVPSEFSGAAVVVNPRSGPWEMLLAQVWPAQALIKWPSALTFDTGGSLSIALLMDRWRIGEAVRRLARRSMT